MLPIHCFRLLLLLAVGVVGVSGFSPLPTVTKTPLTIGLPPNGCNDRTDVFFTRRSNSNTLFAEKKQGTGLDKSMTDKLVKESIAPWRPLRLFLYAALGSGALIGGLITLAGTGAALSGAREDLNLNTELLNLGIDFGAVAIFAVLAKFDLDKGAEFDSEVEEKIEKVKEQKKIVKGMKKREEDLENLLLDIQISVDGTTKTASVREVQAGAKQHMIVVIGNKKACRDALIGANLLKMDFAMSNVLVVPYEIETEGSIEAQIGPSSGGFGDDSKPIYEKQPYIAKATGDGWEEYIGLELDDAIKQSGENVKEEGIALVVASNGKVIRRGVGKVPWRQMVEQLQEEVKA